MQVGLLPDRRLRRHAQIFHQQSVVAAEVGQMGVASGKSDLRRCSSEMTEFFAAADSGAGCKTFLSSPIFCDGVSAGAHLGVVAGLEYATPDE